MLRRLFFALKAFGVDTGLAGGAFSGQVVHLLAHAGLVDAELHGQVDDVAGAPVERQAGGDSATG